MLPGDKLAVFPRVIVELGMGDGRLLKSLADNDDKSLYIGIEIDNDQFRLANSGISAKNVIMINGSFENIVPTFPDYSVDLFMAILPDPAFIDENRTESWKPFYRQLRRKLKTKGELQIITELTNELLQPVTDAEYAAWTGRLLEIFSSLGYTTVNVLQSAPQGYSSRCLDQFRGDPQRVRMVTMNFTKQGVIP